MNNYLFDNPATIEKVVHNTPATVTVCVCSTDRKSSLQICSGSHSCPCIFNGNPIFAAPYLALAITFAVRM